MLFIYGALKIGGIETFFVRMAKERSRLGKPTTLLLLSKPDDSNDELLINVKLYADVFFAKDIFSFKPALSIRFCLLAPINKDNLTNLFKNVDQIHVYHGLHALFGLHLCELLNKNIPITIGFYHYIKYLWGGNKVALHEKINRKFIFDYLPHESLLFFSEGSRDLYSKHKKKSFYGSNIFSLGVVDKKKIKISGNVSAPLKLVAIGRLVEFKTYNFYMIEVVKSLLNKGFKVKLDIFGDGPLYNELNEKIINEGVSKYIKLKGTLNYSKFDEIVSQSDMFIGDGTAIIQASSLGVPSIVGVQNVIEPKTYGYFCNVYMYQYTRKGLDIDFLSVENIIIDYIEMSKSDRLILKEKHLKCIEQFTNQSCQNAMDSLKNITMPCYKFEYNRFIYLLSKKFDQLIMKYNKRHPRLTQFESFRSLDEK